MPARPELRLRLAAAAIAIAVLGVTWSGLFVDAGGGRILILCLLAALPGLAGALPRSRRIAVPLSGLVAAILGLAFVLALSPVALVTDPSAWRQVGEVVPEGLRAASSNDLPIDVAAEPALAALLELALLVLAGAAAWQAGARGAPLGGVIALGAGLAYRWTVLPPEQPVVAGGLGLAAVIAIIALLGGVGRTRAVRPRLAGASTLGVIALAVAVLGAGQARTDSAWLEWTAWELAGASRSETASLDLEQRYGRLDWPETPRVVMRVRSPRRLHLRAASLETFDGIAFRLGDADPRRPLVVRGGRIALSQPATNRQIHSQRVRMAAAKSSLLLAPAEPLAFSGDVGARAERLGDSIRVEPGLGRGSAYTVTSSIPDERPSTLLDAKPPAPAEVPGHLTNVRAGPGRHVVDVPLWGGGSSLPSPAEFGAYAEVVALARRITDGAGSQYAAANLIEAHMRSSYAYDERPPFPNGGTVPIADFVLRTKRGFCQHFAGAMAVMLRGLGIPARVAVGYTGGRFDPERGEWVVVDRDAHSWVEVYFSGHGWIPFDPTPGRAVSSPASVSSPDYAPLEAAVEDGLVEEAVAPTSHEDEIAADAADQPIDGEASAAPPPPSDDGGGGPGSSPLTIAAIGAAILLVLLAPGPAMLRAARRTYARRTGSERERVLAAARHLEREAARHGRPIPESATPGERAWTVRRASGVDVDRLYDLVAQARYGPPRGGLDPQSAWEQAEAARRAIGRRARIWRRLLPIGPSASREGTLPQ